MEYDNIVWIKEEVPNGVGIASQLSTTTTTYADSSLPQVYIFFLKIISVVIETKFWVVLFPEIKFV